MKFENTTEKELMKKEEFRELKCFINYLWGDFYDVDFSKGGGGWINVNEEGRKIFDISLSFFNIWKLYDKKFEDVFKKCGSLYEKISGRDDVDMQTDYSKSTLSHL